MLDVHSCLIIILKCVGSADDNSTSPEWEEYLSKRKGCREVEALINDWKKYENEQDSGKIASVAGAIAAVAVDCVAEEKDKIYEHCYPAFVHITRSCLKSKQFDAARLMTLCRLAVVRENTRKDSCGLLTKLEGLGICFVTLAEYKFSLQERNEVCKICVFIDKVLELMYDIGDFDKLDKNDVIRKNEYIFAVLLKYGAFCVRIENHQKSLAVYSQAVATLRILLGSSAKSYKVLVECYYNIAFSHTYFKQYFLAENSLNEAIAACKCVLNWSDKNGNEKQDYVSKCEDLLNYVRNAQS